MLIADTIIKMIAKAARPVFLIGAGVRQSGTVSILRELTEKAEIPILSSMVAQDTLAISPYYMGYIGSHGLRYSNFILSESDLLVVLGNRLAFNHASETFSIVAKKKIIQVDIENRQSKESLNEILPALCQKIKNDGRHVAWLKYSHKVKDLLNDTDTGFPVDAVANVMKQNPNSLFVSDVGNNGFWVARAYAYACVGNRLLMAKSFAALGCSLPKAIGAYYASHKPIVCFTGDQGLLFNLQELHFIAENKIPISLVLLNNSSSGMIYSIQKAQDRSSYIHTISDGGYTPPDFKRIAEAFKLSIVEIKVPKDIEPPRLPKGRLCYDFIPSLNVKKTENLKIMRKEFYGDFEADSA